MATRVINAVSLNLNSATCTFVVATIVDPNIVVYKPFDAVATILSGWIAWNLVPLVDATGVPDYYQRRSVTSVVLDTAYLKSFVCASTTPPSAEPHKRFNSSATIALNSLSVSSTPTPPQILPAPGRLFPLQGIFLMDPEGTPGP